jgi:hypothetical protein
VDARIYTIFGGPRIGVIRPFTAATPVQIPSGTPPPILDFGFAILDSPVSRRKTRTPEDIGLRYACHSQFTIHNSHFSRVAPTQALGSAAFSDQWIRD